MKKKTSTNIEMMNEENKQRKARIDSMTRRTPWHEGMRVKGKLEMPVNLYGESVLRKGRLIF